MSVPLKSRISKIEKFSKLTLKNGILKNPFPPPFVFTGSGGPFGGWREINFGNLGGLEINFANLGGRVQLSILAKKCSPPRPPGVKKRPAP